MCRSVFEEVSAASRAWPPGRSPSPRAALNRALSPTPSALPGVTLPLSVATTPQLALGNKSCVAVGGGRGGAGEGESEGVGERDGEGEGVAEGGAQADSGPGEMLRSLEKALSSTNRRPKGSTSSAVGLFNRAPCAGAPSPKVAGTLARYAAPGVPAAR